MELLRYLSNYDTVRLDVAAAHFELSEKTLKSRLSSLQGVLQEYGIQTEALPGGQYLVRGRAHFTRLLKENSLRYEMDFDQKCLLLLALNTGYLVVQDIADRLLVSKSYAEKKLGRLLREYPDELHSQRHYGIRYEAPPELRLARIVRILFPYIVGEDFEAALTQFDRLHLPVLSCFTPEQRDKAQKAVGLLRTMELFSFTDESIQQLYLYFLLLLRFCTGETPLRFDGRCRKELLRQRNKPLLEWVSWLCVQLSAELPAEAAGYLGWLLLTLRKQRVEYSEQIREKMRPVLEQIFRAIGTWLAFDLSGDEELCDGLAVRLYTTVMRADMLNTEPDPYTMGDFKRQYPLGFEMAVVTAEYIADLYALPMDEKDLLYLALHYQAAIERLKDSRPKMKVIVVCHFGMAGANIIRSRMERRIARVEVLKTCSLQEFLQEEQPECDFIVTTEQMLQTELPVVYVTLAFPEREVSLVEAYIQNLQLRRRLAVHLMEAPIVHIGKRADPQSVIRDMCAVLEQGGTVLPGYTDSVLEREQRSSTSLFYIALPHGNPALVRQTRLLVARMDMPVAWEEIKAVCAFLFAAETAVLRDDPLLFSTFYRRLSDPETEGQIRDLQTEGQLSDEEFRGQLIRLIACPGE